MANTQTGFTKAISSAITLTENDFVVQFTLMVVTGTCTLLGAGDFQGETGTAITLSAGQTFTKTASPGSFLVGYTITPVAGTTNVDISQ